MCVRQSKGMFRVGMPSGVRDMLDRDPGIRQEMQSGYDRQVSASPSTNFSPAPSGPRNDDGPRMSLPTPSPVRQGIKAVFGDVDVGRTDENDNLIRDPNNPYQKFMETQRKNLDGGFLPSPITAFLDAVFGDKNNMTTNADKITGQIFRQAAANPGTVNLSDDGLGLKIDVPRGTINLSKRGFATYTGVHDPDYEGVFSEIVNPPVEESEDNKKTKTPLDPCPEGYKFNDETQSCEKVETTDEEKILGTNYVRALSPMPDLSNYGIEGGEYKFFSEMPGIIKAKNGLPRQPHGEVKGPGGPKDDLVGPILLSAQEYVEPYERVLDEGNGDYEQGIRVLEKKRMAALRKYRDRVKSEARNRA